MLLPRFPGYRIIKMAFALGALEKKHRNIIAVTTDTPNSACI